MSMSPGAMARFLEHTLLKPDAGRGDVERLCREALDHRFMGVCVHPARVALAHDILVGTEVKVVSVVGFPSGATEGDVKRFEAETVIDLGAQEIDVVINLGYLRDGNDRAVLRELRDVVEAADELPVKVILETALLTVDEKRRACSLAIEAGARFVKTSTGFGPAGATVEDVRLLRECVGASMGVKASGGIRDAVTALRMIEAGATRIGSSSSLAILGGLAGFETATA